VESLTWRFWVEYPRLPLSPSCLGTAMVRFNPRAALMLIIYPISDSKLSYHACSHIGKYSRNRRQVKEGQLPSPWHPRLPPSAKNTEGWGTLILNIICGSTLKRVGHSTADERRLASR
jgi:hypothetical protein